MSPTPGAPERLGVGMDMAETFSACLTVKSNRLTLYLSACLSVGPWKCNLSLSLSSSYMLISTVEPNADLELGFRV
jgi:hypothetical protein